MLTKKTCLCFVHNTFYHQVTMAKPSAVKRPAARPDQVLKRKAEDVDADVKPSKRQLQEADVHHASNSTELLRGTPAPTATTHLERERARIERTLGLDCPVTTDPRDTLPGGTFRFDATRTPSVHDQLAQLKAENEALKTQVQSAQANAKSYAAKSAQLVLRAVKADKALKEAENNAEAAGHRAAAAECKVEQSQHKAEEVARHLAGVEEKLSDMEVDLADAEHRAEEAEHEIILAQRKAAAAERKLSAAERRATASQRKAEEMGRKLAELESRAKSAERKLHLAESQIKTAEHRAEESSWKAEESTRKLVAAEQRAETAERLAEAAESQADAAVREAEDADRKLEEAEGKIEALERRAKEAERPSEHKEPKLAAAYRRASEVERRDEAAEKKYKATEHLRRAANRNTVKEKERADVAEYEREHLAHRAEDAEVCALRAECVAAEAEEYARHLARSAGSSAALHQAALRGAAAARDGAEVLQRELVHAYHRAEDADICALRAESFAAEAEERAETYREKQEKMKKENTQLKRRTTRAEKRVEEAEQRAAEAEEKVDIVVELAGQELALRPTRSAETSPSGAATPYWPPDDEDPMVYQSLSPGPAAHSELPASAASPGTRSPQPSSGGPHVPAASEALLNQSLTLTLPNLAAVYTTDSDDWQRLLSLHAEVQSILGPLHREAESHAERGHAKATTWLMNVELYYGLCGMAAAKMWSLERRGRLMDEGASKDAVKQLEWVKDRAEEVQKQMDKAS